MNQLILKKKQFRSEEGFTLVEVLASIVIISIVVTSFLVFFVRSDRIAVNTEGATRATYYAQEVLEEFYHYSETTSYDELESILMEESVSFTEIPDGKKFIKVEDPFKVELSITSVESEGETINDLYNFLVEVYPIDGSTSKLTQLETRLLFTKE